MNFKNYEIPKKTVDAVEDVNVQDLRKYEEEGE